MVKQSTSNATLVTEPSVMADATTPLKKNGRSSLKGMFRRSPKKKSKKSKAISKETSSSNSVPMPVDNQKVMSANKYLIQDKPSPSKKADSSGVVVGLDLVVLLMHPISHRFELLQLEFDEARKAKVSDLLAQIPLSVTEDCLKSQLYDSILDIDSADKPQVGKKSKLMDVFQSTSETPGSRKMVVVARPQGISDHDALKMAKPIFTNRDISNMLEMSGFDVSSWKRKKFSSRSSQEDSSGEDSAPIQNSSLSYTMLGFVFALIIGNLAQSIMVQPISPDFVVKPGRYQSKCGLYGLIPFKPTARKLFQALPLAENLEPQILSCQDEFLHVAKDGTATIYNAEKQAVLVLEGAVCTPRVPGCVNGLVMKGDNKSLEIGGKPVKQATVLKSYKTQQLSPWPFEEEPTRLRYKTVSELK